MKRERSTYNLSSRSVLSTVAGRLCTRLASAQERSNRGILMPLLTLGVLLSALSIVAPADQYWVAWEGNDFPENEGWLREGAGEWAWRSLAEGAMTLDSLANEHGQDFYSVYGASDPGPGEEFVVQWRLRVDDIHWANPIFPFDPGWSINSADGWRAVFIIGLDELQSMQEHTSVFFQPDVFHEWSFRSVDMRTYSIELDGTQVSSGAFVLGLPEASLSWGDFVWGPTSRVEWDYVRFGVVPEPSTGVVFAVVLYRISRRKR